MALDLAAARLITLCWHMERAQVPGRRTTANTLAFPPLRLLGLLTRGCLLVSLALLAVHRLSASCPLRALSLKKAPRSSCLLDNGGKSRGFPVEALVVLL